MKDFDFVIIGGGCAGLSLAYELEINNKLKNIESSDNRNFVSEEDLEECRADDSLVEMQYGWMDFATYKGWRAYHAECHVCHGPDAMGSTYAPSLMVSLQEGLSYDDFFNVIMNGRGEAEGAQKGNVMPAFGANTNVAPHVEDMYRYVKARAEGKIRRGVRLPKLPKFKEAE